MAERERKKEICSPPPVPQPWTLHGGRNRWTETVFRDEKERDWNRQVCHATDYTAGAPFHAIYRGAIVYQSTRRETRGEHRAQRLLFNVILIYGPGSKDTSSVSLGINFSQRWRATDQASIQADLKNII